MKRLIVLIILSIQFHFTYSQNELQKCSEERNRELTAMNEQRRGVDSATRQRFIKLDKEWKTCVVGKAIPTFDVRTLSNSRIASKDLKNKIVVINFWFIACPPCVAEIPALNQLVEEYKDQGCYSLGLRLKRRTR